MGEPFTVADSSSWALSTEGGWVQSWRHRALHRSSSSMFVPWLPMRRIRVMGWPSGVVTLTITQFGMANTSGDSSP